MEFPAKHDQLHQPRLAQTEPRHAAIQTEDWPLATTLAKAHAEIVNEKLLTATVVSSFPRERLRDQDEHLGIDFLSKKFDAVRGQEVS